jgi:dihydroxyacetone kinase
MLSAAVCGDVFCSPSWAQIYAAVKAVGGPKGVLMIVKNYMGAPLFFSSPFICLPLGDIINFKIAAQFARQEGIECAIVVVADDVALLDRVAREKARGLAGTRGGGESFFFFF